MINSHDTSKPLFLYLAHEAVHSALGHEPLEAPKDLINKFEKSIHDDNRRIFAAMATALDQSIGKVFLTEKYEVMKDVEHNSQVISQVCRNGPGLSPGWGHCVVFLARTLYSRTSGQAGKILQVVE